MIAAAVEVEEVVVAGWSNVKMSKLAVSADKDAASVEIVEVFVTGAKVG